MKKRMLTSLSFLFIISAITAQVKEGKVNFQKAAQPAAVLDLPYAEHIVETAIASHLSTKGVKGNDSKGFKTFRKVRIGDTLTSDLYFKVERRSQNESTVYLFVTAPDENPAGRSVETAYVPVEAKQFLHDLAPAAEASFLEAQIKEQQETVGKAERKLKNLVDDGQDLQKRRLNIEEKIAENQQEQERQKVELEKQRQNLSRLMDKRRA